MTMEQTTRSSDNEHRAGSVQPYQFEPVDNGLAEEESNLTETWETVNVFNRLENTDWCLCGNCIIMATEVECCCCRESTQIWGKVLNHRSSKRADLQCITEVPGFEHVCLNPDVLETAYFQYKQEHGAMQATQEEKYRYTAYRQLVRWCFGILGRTIRVPLPSCAVNAIRTAFPSDDFTGFQYPNL